MSLTRIIFHILLEVQPVLLIACNFRFFTPDLYGQLKRQLVVKLHQPLLDMVQAIILPRLLFSASLKIVVPRAVQLFVF